MMWEQFQDKVVVCNSNPNLEKLAAKPNSFVIRGMIYKNT